MNKMFEPYIVRYVIFIIDDGEMYLPDQTKHDVYLQYPFHTLCDHQFYAKVSKIFFGLSIYPLKSCC